MANLYGVNYSKSVAVPPTIIDHAEVNGRSHIAYDEYTLEAVIADADVIYLSKIPSGARVLSIRIISPSLGTTGTVNVGTVDVPDLFATNVAVNGGAVDKVIGSLAKMAKEEQLILTATAATTESTGTIQVAVEFIVA